MRRSTYRIGAWLVSFLSIQLKKCAAKSDLRFRHTLEGIIACKNGKVKSFFMGESVAVSVGEIQKTGIAERLICDPGEIV